MSKSKHDSPTNNVNITQPHGRAGEEGSVISGLIHPIITFPYSFPNTTEHLGKLYEELIAKKVNTDPRFTKPITVINQQTMQRNEKNSLFEKAVKMAVNYSDTRYTWSVDTCQMWLSGIGAAYEHGNTGDVYWLIPGDFLYAGKNSIEGDTLNKMLKIPLRVNKQEKGQTIELCLGRIDVPLNMQSN